MNKVDNKHARSRERAVWLWITISAIGAIGAIFAVLGGFYMLNNQLLCFRISTVAFAIANAIGYRIVRRST